jgi:hypothetical protein
VDFEDRFSYVYLKGFRQNAERSETAALRCGPDFSQEPEVMGEKGMER